MDHAARGLGGASGPRAWIRKLAIPALWLYGGLDKVIPDRLSVRRLEPIAGEAGRDFTVVVFPNGNHALVETRTGLTAEMLRSDRFAPARLVPARRVVAPRARTRAHATSFSLTDYDLQIADYLHTMVRITDPEKSRAFYAALGFRFSRDLDIFRKGGSRLCFVRDPDR